MVLFDNEMVADNTVYPEYVWRRQSKKRLVPYINVCVIYNETTPEMKQVFIMVLPATGTKAKTNKIVHSYDVSSKSEAHRTYRAELRRVLFF